VSITLNLSFASVTEMRAALAEMLAGVTPPTVAPSPIQLEQAVAHAAEIQAKADAAPKVAAKVEEERRAPKQVKAEKAEKPAATASAAPEVEPEKSTDVGSTPPSDGPTYDDVAAIVIKVSKAKGRPHVVELLKPFGIPTFTAAKPEQYADIKRVMEEALA